MPREEETFEYGDTREKYRKKHRARSSLNIHNIHLNSGSTLAILKTIKNLGYAAIACNPSFQEEPKLEARMVCIARLAYE